MADDAHDLASREEARAAQPASDRQVSSGLARRTLWNRMWGPPIVREGLTPRRLRELNGIRAFGLGLALAVDGVLYLGLRAEPLVRNTALIAFLAVNVPLLLLDLALVLGMRRANRAPALVLGLSVALEMFTTIVWTQATGSVSSYFLLVPPFLIFLYRFMIGYGPGLACLVTAMVFHAGAVVLERLGVLAPGALFVAPPGPMYESAGFHLGALVSIQSIFMLAFACSNYLSRALREKDEALREAHDDLERAIDEARPGRLTGQTVGAGRYRLLEVLGRGGMGEVYRAERADHGGAVAVKVLHGHLSDSATAIARFQREIDAVRALPTAFTAPVLESGVSRDGSHYLVMELLEGEDLAALLRRKPRLEGPELAPILEQLGRILDAAHAAGIVHRDVKPQNVFLVGQTAGSREVRLLDFGIARLLADDDVPALTETALLVGTPGYLAPEQVAAAVGALGPSTDVFAMGAVAYRAITGRPAFASRHPVAAAYEALHVDPPAPSSIVAELSTDVDAVIALALAKRPADRYASAGELARDLSAALRGRLDPSVHTRASSARTSAPPPMADRTLTDG